VGAIRMLAANDLRRRWLATIAVALLIGIVGGIVMAAVAGARRSDASLRRFNAEARSADLEIAIGKTPTTEQIRAFETAIGARGGLIRVYGMTPRNRSDVNFGTTVDGTFGSAVDRQRVVHGRLANPNAVDEIDISEKLSQQTGVGVGGVLDTVTLSAEQLAHGEFAPPRGPQIPLRVVGITRRPGDLSDMGASGGVVALTPAFDRKYVDELAWFTYVLRVPVAGTAQEAQARQLAQQMFGKDENFLITEIAAENNGAQKAIDVLTVATLIFALVAAGAGLFTVGIVVFREIARSRAQQATLRAMGLTRLAQVNVNLPRAAVTALGGGALAVATAVALSPLFPFGVARRADPDPGVHADWLVLGLGAAIVMVFVLGVALIASVRVARPVDDDNGARRRSVADALAVSRLRPTAANGIRMAFDPGRDERAVPLRSAFIGAIVGVLGVTAVLVLASSLGTLVDRPARYGWTWDLKARDPNGAANCDGNTLGMERVRGISDLAAVCYRDGVVNGRQTVLWGFRDLRGSIAPTIVAGRGPTADDEVALGADTMSAAGVRIGDPVQINGGQETRTFRVVGRTVFPPMKSGDLQHLADGAAVTGDAFQRVVRPADDQSGATGHYVVARIAPGTSTRQVARDIEALPVYVSAREQFGFDPAQVGDAVGGPQRPPEVDRLERVAWFGPALAILMGALALVAVAHALITATRRRRHDLAVLKAIGFNRRQVRATLAWEATTLALVGLLFGLPLGIIAGRLAWAIVADNIGIATTITLPALALVLVVPATLLLVNAVAYLPARAAARARTSVVLAVE
jgi:ABC-type antimicrobial peptide transport system permease subunit